MLKILGEKYRLCDGVSRRSFLQIGGLTMGGLTLPDLLRTEAQAGQGRSHKSVIMIFLAGGAPHQDTVDLKMDAPVEIRGEFKPISTRVPGTQICELMPKIADRVDRLSIIRSMVGSEGRHDAFQCMTGQLTRNQPPGGWPSLGSSVSKLRGMIDPAVPPFVGLSPKMIHSPWSKVGQSGFAGPAHAAFKPNADGSDSLVLGDVNMQRMNDRRALMRSLDTLRREADAADVIQGMDASQQQAFGILTSSKLADALDLEKEDPKLRDRYGRGSNKPAGYGDAGPLQNDYFLQARRLIEAGVRVVTLAYGRWDWHGRPHGTNFEHARIHLPMLDQGLSTLMDDLRDRGMDKDVTVIVWGEFGRAPRINKNGGRDHWPQVSSAMLLGGGMNTGQVIGATNRLGEHATKRPVHFQEVYATLYRNLGIDIDHATINDFNGRPRYLIDNNKYRPLPELM